MRSTNRVFRLGFALIFSVFSLVTSAAIANAVAPGFAPGNTTRVSLSSSGVPAIGNGLRSGGLSADGHYVVFASTATNLGATGQQVYRRACGSRDCTTGTTEVVSVTPANVASSGFSPSVSKTGRYVAFVSFSNDLVAGVTDTNNSMDVFLRDMEMGSTVLVSAIGTGVSVTAVGGTLSSLPDAHVVSDDGLKVAFVSASRDLATDPTNLNAQIYVKDRSTGAVELASTHEGFAGDGPSSSPSLSGDGRYVAFTSTARNLKDSPTTASSQIYVRDLVAKTTSLESVTWDNLVVTNGGSSTPALSNNGTYLAFESTAQLDNRSGPDDRGDHDTTVDVYVRQRGSLGTTELVSYTTMAVGLDSRSPSVSDGGFVAFQSLDLFLVPGDSVGSLDVFLFDPTTKLRTFVSLNNDGVQANLPSREPSLSADGTLVLFASSATNLVADPFTTNLQLYLRDLAPNDDPAVNLPSTLDLAFSRDLVVPGTFTDTGGSSETHWATVNYGDSTGTQELALVGGSFSLDHTYAAADTYIVTVTVNDSNGGSTTVTMVVRVSGYTYEWLDPVGTSFTVGRNLPVKFIVRGPDGSPVLDDSVRVDVVDLSTGVVVRTYFFGTSPSRSVTWNGSSYHVNVDTKELSAGSYELRVQFSSATLSGEFTLATNGTAGAVRSRLRD